MAEAFTKGGQEGWYHDPGHWGGYFHTYDHFQIAPGDRPRKLHIFLPRDYEISDHSYPVLYMQDGDTSFFPGGAFHHTWDMGRILTRLYLRLNFPKVIVVAVCPGDRDYEYTHAPVWGSHWGGLADYADYFVHHLKRFIDANYRTQGDPLSNVAIGASHGGLAAFYLGVTYPDHFGQVIAMSPSFWVGIDSSVELSFHHFHGPFFGSLRESSLLAIAHHSLEQKRLRFYFDWGLERQGGFHHWFTEERATARGREMVEILQKDYGYIPGKDLMWVEETAGEHNEISWARRLPGALQFCFPQHH